MKCPKCGFQSFNYLATCKKCGRDLSELRDRLGLGDPTLPGRAGYAAGSSQPLVEDPFDTTLPDEKDICTVAEMASLNDDETDADLENYFDELGTVDEELAATLDPDMDWTGSEVTFDSFVIEEDPAEPLLPGDEPPHDIEPTEAVGPVDEEPAPEEDADVFTDTEGRGVDSFEGGAVLESNQGPGDEELALDDDLDTWLSEGEELPWRRTKPDVALEDQEPLPPFGSEEAQTHVDAEAKSYPTDFPEQVELPFADEVEEVSQRAPLASRGLAFVFDAGLLAAVFVVFVLSGEYLRQGMGDFRWPQPQSLADHIGPYFLVFFGLAFGYFTLFHYLGGQTPGKMAGKLLVVDTSGEPLHLSQAFLRTVGGLMCLLPAGLGFCSMLLNREGRGWNDRLAGSLVIPANQVLDEEGLYVERD
jgi:uncharacterized RDD family membrane protein YckC